MSAKKTKIMNTEQMDAKTRSIMNARTTMIKGLQYCKGREVDNPYCPCDGCPFEDKIMCIDEYGELSIHRGKEHHSFEDFAKDFNFMIEELYKDD